jgi:hypothetical protein
MKKIVGVFALIVLAGLVTGREQQAVTPVLSHTAARSSNSGQSALRPLDMRGLEERKRETSIKDIFAIPSAPADRKRIAPAEPLARPPVVTEAALPPAPPPPPAPVAPALPFKYLGRMDTGEKSIVYLVRNQEILVAGPGDPLGNDYRVEAVSDSTVDLVYLPFGIKQVLAIPPVQ